MGHAQTGNMEMLHETTIGEYDGFSVRKATVALADGSETTYTYVSEPDIVIVIPVTDTDEFVVIDEQRAHQAGRGFPAGSVERQDCDCEDTARRELREETGYEANHLEHLATVDPVHGSTDTAHHYYLADGCAMSDKQRLEPDEMIEVTTVTPERLYEQVVTNEVQDSRVVTGMFYYSLAD
jgi:ADP-ribose pyrophosphatase